jgi:hypothetical protein
MRLQTCLRMMPEHRLPFIFRFFTATTKRHYFLFTCYLYLYIINKAMELLTCNNFKKYYDHFMARDTIKLRLICMILSYLAGKHLGLLTDQNNSLTKNTFI